MIRLIATIALAATFILAFGIIVGNVLAFACSAKTPKREDWRDCE